ncbi:hypothetical protein BOTBODRAFT_38203 [Botryobasidium botryosum FD-172 SS1]|uniref:SMAD/FHA domain-containing protein n=1 Tax=Botryobasidium botryosum (strain FD-172 SS1) TaxID=930990 RepID=A0A067M895_BOTB1|nr:hypothetical protein BOTBODRAFT_38203 [Botryobasidium botryosum FD-172 SS1]
MDAPHSPIRQSLLHSLIPGRNRPRRPSAPATPSHPLPDPSRPQSQPPASSSVPTTGPRPSRSIPESLHMAVDAPAASTRVPPPPPPNSHVHRIRLVPHLECRSLHFEPIVRDVIENGPVLRIGRFTERQSTTLSASNATTSTKIAFKSKVVSRGHAELWCETGGKFFIKDIKSSSGTFLNHIRLSPPTAESRAFAVKDGDVLQLGVDYQGGAEEIYRCVKIRVEVGREWQLSANAFNTNALKQINSLTASASGSQEQQSSSTTDCCICLFAVTVCQALFIAPCSHAFHYKCIRPLLLQHHPGFSCPLCRTFADLDMDVEVDDAVPVEPAKEAPASARASKADGPTGGRSLNAPSRHISVDPMVVEIDENESADDIVTDEVEPPVIVRLPAASTSGNAPIPIDATRANRNATPPRNGDFSEVATPLNNTFLAMLATRPAAHSAVVHSHPDEDMAERSVHPDDEDRDDGTEGEDPTSRGSSAEMIVVGNTELGDTVGIAGPSRHANIGVGAKRKR